jgi:sugar phosphate isomerase/epimerase
MQTAEDIERILMEVLFGWDWGDPRTRVPQTAENRETWLKVAQEVVELTEAGIEIEVPFEMPFPDELSAQG